jgi:hypothetical protein
MIASEYGDSVFVTHFERHQERDCLYRVIASIDIVSHEQIIAVTEKIVDYGTDVRLWGHIRGGWLASNPKEFHEIMELAMNVSTNCHRTFHRLHIGLLDEQLPSLFTQGLDVLFRERLALFELFDPLVHLGPLTHSLSTQKQKGVLFVFVFGCVFLATDKRLSLT